MHADGEPSWSILGGELYWESWECEHAVFHSLSGETHLLPDFTALVLRKMGDGACTARELAMIVCSEIGDPCDENFVMGITRLLRQLQAVGLVEPSVT